MDPFEERRIRQEKFEAEKCSPQLGRTIAFCNEYNTKKCPKTCSYASKLEEGLDEN